MMDPTLVPGECFETERLEMRLLGIEDAEALHRISSRWEVVRYAGWKADWSVEVLEDLICEWLLEAPRLRVWGVREKGSELLIGTVDFTLDGRTGTVGYIFHDDVWGQGYATEAVTALLDAAFRSALLARARASIRPQNTASIRVAEKLGMRHTESPDDWHAQSLGAREWLYREYSICRHRWLGLADPDLPA